MCSRISKVQTSPALGMEFCWSIRCMLEKSRPNTSNITRKESTTLKSLKNNKQIWILQADKGNCTVVLNESAYKEKIVNLLESGVCEILRKDSVSQIERYIRNCLQNMKLSFPLPWNINWLHTTVNHLTCMDLPRYTNLTSFSDQ
jgi:hypothetical protein